MKKAFDQTVRDLKREVNKKVLKVPGIEQKVLDATSNEPWGPHGTHLADIAQATRNYHEYQMIMSVIWKRINDTGKNWRHVYKALTVLEYLVGHGSERVIDEIREHAYQISTLADFQYIDSSGRDQGNNVRKKSQSLVALVNDKERVQEVRQKAAANREKFRNTSFSGGMYRPSSYSSSGGYGDHYDDDRHEGRYGRDEDRNGYGREREWGSRDDDRYGRNGDSYGREGDHYGRDSEDRYSRDGYKDDDYRGRSRSNEDYQYGSRSRSADRERDRAFDEGSNHSSRGGARTDEHPQYGRRLERKFSEQNLDAPPSYEEAVTDAQSPVHDERDGETPAAPAPKTSPPVSTSPTQAITAAGPASPPANKKVDSFDEFDPRCSVSAAPAAPITPMMDLLGSLSESFPSNSLALVPAGSATTTSEVDVLGNAGSVPTSGVAPSGSAVVNQAFDDPFGDGPFRALPSSEGVPVQPQDSASTTSFQFNMNQSSGPPFPTQGVSTAQPPPASSQFSSQEQWIPQQSNDILADILPPSGSSAHAVPAPTGQSLQPNSHTVGGFPHPSGSADHAASQFSPQIPTGPAAQYNSGDFLSQLGSAVPVPSQAPLQGSGSSQSPFQAPSSQPPFQAPGPSQSSFQAPAPLQSPFNASVPAQGPFQPPVPSQGPFQPPVPSQAAFQPSGPPQIPFQASGPLQTPFQTSGPPQTPFQASGPPQTPFQASGPSQTPFQPSGPSQTPFQASGPSQAPFQYPSGPATHPSNDTLSGIFTQAGSLGSVTSQSTATGSTGSHAIIPQSSKDKFEPKSTVWADTLSRGLVNLNISGPKINPLADIGIDFDAINRKEKRMEKPNPAATAPVSTTTMGKAMGTGSGLGRAGASSLRPPQNPMMGSGMGMGMGSGRGAGMSNMGMGMGMGMGGGPGGGIGMGMGMGMGGYGGVNQQPMGMGMNMGIGQGAQMQQPTGMRPGGYNPMLGPGGYAPQQPYGGGYR